MMTLWFSVVALIFSIACLAVCIMVAVAMTRGHLRLARKDRAEILATKDTAVHPNAWYWRGCECFICRIFDNITVHRGHPTAR